MNNIYYFTAVLHKEDVGYSIWIDELSGCNSQGDLLSEAITNIKDAIGLFYEDYKSRNESFPVPNAPENIKLEENETAVLIEFDALEYAKKHDKKAVKKTLTIPSWLNTVAEENNINFSSVLQSALKQKLNIQ